MQDQVSATELVKDTTTTGFRQDVIAESARQPVLVDFWAPWCGPCKAIAPSIDELANEYDGKVKFVKINVDDNPQTPAKYGVRGIPNLLIIKGGQVKEQIIGAVPKAHLKRAVDGALT